MKPAHLLAFVLTIASLALLFACGGNPPPTPVPPTAIPTLVPPTAVPPTAVPTKPPAPTNTTAASTGSATETVSAAFQKFLGSTVFRLNAAVTTSPTLFQPNYEPQPGDDPNVVTVVSMQGEQENANLDFTLGGFGASFIGLFLGFDPNVDSLRIVSVNGEHYINGVPDGETEAKWYKLPGGDTSTTEFSPQELIGPIAGAKFANDAFTAAGTEIVDGKNCGVFEGNRAAFELVLPDLSQAAILNTDVFDASTVDAFTFKVWACDDGHIHRVQYTFEAHTKADASKKGSVSFDAQFKDYGEAIVIQAPADALPFDGGVFNNTSPTTEPSPTTVITTNFTSLNGEWEGIIGEDSPISFTVEDNKVTYINVNYSISTGSCSSGGSYGTSVDDGSAITASAFNFVLTDSDNVKFTVNGKFASNKEASGTLAIQGNTFCGDVDSETPWTARHISSPDDVSAPTEEPTEEATEQATAQATAEATPDSSVNADAAATINAVFDALADKDVNTALAAMDDNVVYNIAGSSGIGKSSLQSSMQLAIAAGASFQVSNINDLGGLVTFTVTVTGIGAGTYPNSSAVVEDGKISLFTIQ